MKMYPLIRIKGFQCWRGDNGRKNRLLISKVSENLIVNNSSENTFKKFNWAPRTLTNDVRKLFASILAIGIMNVGVGRVKSDGRAGYKRRNYGKIRFRVPVQVLDDFLGRRRRHVLRRQRGRRLIVLLT